MVNLNRPVSIKDTELLINNLPKQKATGPNGLIDGFYQPLEKLIIPIVYITFQRREAEEIHLNSCITLIPKPEQSITRKIELQSIYMNIFYKHRCKSS